MDSLTISEEPILRVGTDCSGIEAPLQALRQLGIPFTHEFSCEIDKHCQESIKANYYPKKSYEDITKRNVDKLPDIDLYVCGFPCQPFSCAGKRKGFNDSRGNIFWDCLDVIKTKQPKFFILENVKALLWHDKKRTWNVIQKEIENLEFYDCFWKVLNTRHYGIPQNRERVYIVGIRQDTGIEFTWPEPSKEIQPIQDFIDENANHKDVIRDDVIKSGMLDRIPSDSVFVDFSFKKHSYPNANKYCPSIAADSRLWCVPKHRYATPDERLALQGFGHFEKPDNVSVRQLNKQIGNSMSVNVLKAIMENLVNL